jgi:hypothetical protein
MAASLPTSLLEYNPFPRNSVNLLVGPTNSGKTYFVTTLVNNYKVYFSGPVHRILVVLCNDRVQPIDFDPSLEVPIEQISLTDFVPDNLCEHDLVLLDDVQTVTEPIKLTITVCAHHYNLTALFVITHSLLGNPNFALVNYCHRLFLFMRSSSNIRQLTYVINHFYFDTEIKTYLKSVLGFCQREKEVLALELNPLASQAKQLQVVLAFSHLSSYLDKGYFLLYPYPQWGSAYVESITSNQLSVTKKMSESFPYGENDDLPQPTLVAVPVSVVLQSKAAAAAGNKSGAVAKCSEQEQWEETNREIEDNIESYFPPPRWQKIKNLAKEILRHPQFCVKTDGKTFHVKDRPRTMVAMIDFLAVATRRAAPMEKDRDPTWKLYAMYVEMLLKNNAPRDLFKNKFLVPVRYQQQ